MVQEFSTFISAEELLKQSKNGNFVIIDSRFDLFQPNWGYQDYLKGHIPGAVYAHLENDLSGKITMQTGRHPLPDKEKFFKVCSSWGIDHNKQVIVYDTTSGSFAGRLWWMLNYYGHDKVAILDGGFSKWINLGFSIETGAVVSHPSSFTGIADKNLLVTTSEMETIISDPKYTIIDARSKDRYLGVAEPIDTIAGHIPNAKNFFHQSNLTEDGLLLPMDTLVRKYSDLMINQVDNSLVVYCGSGVTSCLNIAVMQHLGIKDVKLYLGSWSEWIRDKNHPIISD